MEVAVSHSRWPGFRISFVSLVIAAAAAPCTVGASVINDAHFFDSFPTTLINFQTDGAGLPVNLISGETSPMPAGEYSAFGVTFSRDIYWVNDGNSAFQGALQIGGSPKISLPASLVSSFDLSFSVPVQAFGFFVVNNRNVDPLGPTFTAYNSQNEVIDTIQFTGALVDGTIQTSNTTADYGFMGLTSSQYIARVTITKPASILDDLRFSPVPTPGAIALVAMGGLVLARRRRTP